jgi:long-chain acyl-CoA synthetase
LNLGIVLFKGLRKKAGMGTLKYFITGGAAIDPETSKFFNRFGILMLQGFGITETSPLTHFTPPSKIRHDCVGLPIPDLKCKISNPDADGVGELYVKGANVFMGYYKNEKATREAFDEEGWFKTGDLGKIHEDGYLQITGRKKNLIVTPGGKNVYPEEIEHYLNRSIYIAESIVMGILHKSGTGEDVGALIYPDYEQIDIYFDNKQIQPNKEDIHKLIKSEIKKALIELQSYKQIRKFKIHEEEFQKTSTRKIKRFLYDTDSLLTVN